MSKLAFTGLCALCVCLTLVGSVAAEPTLGVYFDTAGTQRVGTALPSVPFNFYIVAKNIPSNDIFGYEFTVNVPPELSVNSRILFGPAPLNVGSGDNFIVGTGGCSGGGGPTVLVQYQVVATAPVVPNDLVIGLSASTPSSFTPAEPGYLRCNSDLVPFSCWASDDGGEAVLNQVDYVLSQCESGDNTPPMITCPGNITVECVDENGAPATHPSIVAFLNGASATDDTDPSPVITNNAPAQFPIGTTTVMFTATDASINSSSCSADVTVQDMTRPEVTCPPAITVDCTDPCGTPASDSQLTTWFAGFSATDDCDPNLDEHLNNPTCFPLGTTEVIYEARDDAGNVASCTTSVTVQDMSPPEITIIWNRTELWPPNHKMVDIYPIECEITDVCDTDPQWVLESITSDEAPNGIGDGYTDADIADADFETPDKEFQLRSERKGNGDGRKYTIIYRAWDVDGNTVRDTSCVTVPHDQGANGLAAYGFTSDGTAFAPGARTFTVVIPSADAVYTQQGNRQVLLAPEVIAGKLDPSRAQVGNTAGVVWPMSSRVLDVNGDRRPDLLVTYDVSAAIGIHTDEGSPEDLGLHFINQDGTPLLISNIFDLGAPITGGFRFTELGGRTDFALDDGSEPRLGVEVNRFDNGIASIFPNPFNPTTTIRFTLAEPGNVRVAVYDVRGALVRVLVNGNLPTGKHTADWDGRDLQGRPAASGVYFTRMRVGTFEQTRKMVLLK